VRISLAGQGWALAGLGGCHARLGNYHLARRYARQALELAPEAGDPLTSAFAWDALGLVHCRLGEPRQAIICYRQALAFLRGRKDPMARGMLVRLLADFGDACRAAGDLPAAVGAWQQVLQILHDLGMPQNPEILAKLEQAGSSTTAGKLKPQGSSFARPGSPSRRPAGGTPGDGGRDVAALDT
jgi:tetratricopeptide (TPR) repeat protein